MTREAAALDARRTAALLAQSHVLGESGQSDLHMYHGVQAQLGFRIRNPAYDDWRQRVELAMEQSGAHGTAAAAMHSGLSGDDFRQESYGWAACQDEEDSADLYDPILEFVERSVITIPSDMRDTEPLALFGFGGGHSRYGWLAMHTGRVYVRACYAPTMGPRTEERRRRGRIDSAPGGGSALCQGALQLLRREHESPTSTMGLRKYWPVRRLGGAAATT